MYTIVGLGNPGEQYADSRHNAGAIAVRAFGETEGLPAFVSSSKFSGEISEGVIGDTDVRLLLPTTYMNHSGTSVRNALREGGNIGDLIVVYDELDLPLGTFKLSYGRGAGGHNGVRSVMDTLASGEFVRLRIGISPVSFFGALKRPSGARAADFVLQNFSRRERAKLDALLPSITRALRTAVIEGCQKAMNAFNEHATR